MPLLANFATWMSSMSGAFRRLLFIQIKKRIGAIFFWFCFLCSYKENELADRAKYEVTIINKATTSEDEKLANKNQIASTSADERYHQEKNSLNERSETC